jgi:PAS domain S-box-containing protein
MTTPTLARRLQRGARRLLLALLYGLALVLCPAFVAGTSDVRTAAPAAEAVATESFLNSLSEAERVWLHEHPVIRVAQDPSWPPIEFADGNGVPSGMTSDYLKIIEQRLGLKLERVLNLTWQDAYARMKRWEIDMTTTVAATPDRETFWAFTKPYLTIPIVIVTRGDVAYIADLRELEGRKVAVVDGYVANIWISRDFPKILLVRVKTTEDALAMLHRGDVFACVENMLVVGHYLAELKITNLKITGSTPYNNAQSMAVRKDWAPLAGILDKALDSVSSSERDSIYRKWLPLRYEYGFDYAGLLPVAVILVAALLSWAAWQRRRLDKVRLRSSEDRRLRPWQAYLIACCATVATFGLRVALDGPLGQQPTLVIFTLPIMLSAYLGGLHVGLLATALTFFGASYYLLPPIHSFTIASGVERWQQFFVALAGVFISLLSEMLHRARRRADLASREHQQAEECVRTALNETHDLRAALDEHAIVATTDSQGTITFVNDKFCAISQYSRAELIGHDHRLINSGFHAKEFIRNLWTTIANGGVWHGEIKNQAKDGSFYWVDTTIVPFLGVDGKPRQYVAIRADITERKRAEAAVRDSEARFRTMANSMPQLAWIAQADGYIGWYNQRWHEYTGTTLEQMQGWGWQSVHDPEVLAKVMTIWTNAIAAGQPFEMEFPLRGADGQFRNFLTRGHPFKDSAGKVVQWFGTNTDVEALKRAEETVHRLNDELEHRVIERTVQLEAANKELEAFSYSVSHDLRAPLRAVNGFAKIVLDTYAPELPPKAREYLEEIRTGGERMGQLIDDLLAFSRLGRHALKLQRVDTGRLVQEVLDFLAPQYAGRPFEIKIGELPGCLGDPSLLKQVWLNLVSNAVKYTRGRTPASIELGCERKDDEIIYFVCDNGAGFDIRYVHKLFGVFQRLHRADEFEGTGVGLAIVQRIIHRHGGRVWAEGEIGRGAKFRFTLGQEK